MRTHIAIGLCTSFMLLAACDFGTRLPTHPTETGPVAPAPPPPFVPSSTIDRDITVGEVVTDTVTESQPACARIDGWWIPCRQYRLTATATGTLVVRLTWDPFHNGVLLMLRLDSHDLTGSAPPWSPFPRPAARAPAAPPCAPLPARVCRGRRRARRSRSPSPPAR